MIKEEININQTHIRLFTDLKNNSLKSYIFTLRNQLETFNQKNPDFLISYNPIDLTEYNPPEIVKIMDEASKISDVGPMATVAGSISELSLKYLMKNNSKTSIVENGGDIAIINNKKITCGIYSNNNILGNNIGFKLKPRKESIGICSSSGKIGHSVSFGSSDCVTIIAKEASIADGLATRIANEVKGENSQEAISNCLDCLEKYKDYFEGALIICEDKIATFGKLPKIVETEEFGYNKI